MNYIVLLDFLFLPNYYHNYYMYLVKMIIIQPFQKILKYCFHPFSVPFTSFLSASICLLFLCLILLFFLFDSKGSNLKNFLFPLGHLQKEEVGRLLCFWYFTRYIFVNFVRKFWFHRLQREEFTEQIFSIWNNKGETYCCWTLQWLGCS